MKTGSHRPDDRGQQQQGIHSPRALPAIAHQLVTPPPLEQLIAAELLGQRLDPVLADRRDRLRAQRDHLAGLLTQTGWTYTVPDGGLSLWLHLGADTTGTELAAYAARRGLAVSPGQHFAADRSGMFGIEHARMAEGCRRRSPEDKADTRISNPYAPISGGGGLLGRGIDRS